MVECTKCSKQIDEDVLPGSKVYGKLAGSEDRDDILSAYSGIQYGTSTVYCTECLDTPRECNQCGGTGVTETSEDSSGDEAESEIACPKCDGTGTTKPEILRGSCRF